LRDFEDIERDGIVVDELRVAMSINASLIKESRGFVWRVEWRLLPKLWRRVVRRLYVDVLKVGSRLSFARNRESSLRSGTKCGRKELPTLTSVQI
jgi:hypothetical protein